MMASSIGLVVTAGITNTFVQMSQRIRQIEAKQQREIFYNYIRRHFKDPENCKATLNAKGGFASGAKTYYADAGDSTKDLDGDGTDDHEWTIPKLLVPDGSDADTDPDVHLDFYPADQTKKDSLEKRFWEKWGIEKFDSIMFIHDKANGSHLRVHIWNIAPGGMPYPAGPYMIPLTVETDPATSPDKGEEITFCSSEKTEGAQKTSPVERYFDECGGDEDTNPYILVKGGGLVSQRNTTIIGDFAVGVNSIICKGLIYANSPGYLLVSNKSVLTGDISTLKRVVIRDGAKADLKPHYLGTSNSITGEVTISGEGTEVKGMVLIGDSMYVNRGPISISGGAKIDGTQGRIQISGKAKISGGQITAAPLISLTPQASIGIGENANISGGTVSGKDIGIRGDARISGGTVSNGSSFRGHVNMLGGEVSYSYINGNADKDNPIIIKQGAEIKGKPGASISIVGKGTIESGAKICRTMTVSGTVSAGDYGCAPAPPTPPPP